MREHEILHWLRETNEERLEELWRRADTIRRQWVGDEVHLRGLVEVSNHCARSCGYCGIRAPNDIERYRMSEDEILECAHQARAFGYGTVVLQAGEDPGLRSEMISRVVRRIKGETSLAVTLSLGERAAEELAAWREAGADRYLMRFETSNESLYRRIHPPLRANAPSRLEILRLLRELCYEVGSGVMVGIPGQTYSDLARDLQLFQELDLDMIGIGPFIKHPDTPLGGAAGAASPVPDQAPGGELMTYKMVALARILCPGANIPSTTALSTVNLEQGRELGLSRGANIVMPNLTPVRYRVLYEIYPDKACIMETPDQCAACLRGRIHRIGRVVGEGRGDSPNIGKRTGAKGAPPVRATKTLPVVEEK